MKLIFVDETSNPKAPGFYGVCAVVIDATHYASVATDFLDRIKQSNWTEGIEFKGCLLFSSTKGDRHVSIDDRIELARQLISLNVAQQNAKLQAVFAWNRDGDAKDNHLALLNTALRKLLSARPPSKKQGKHLCVVFADENQRVSSVELGTTVRTAVTERCYQLVEEVVIARSTYHHVGICLADLIAYLASWLCLEDIEGAQRSLFEQEGITLSSTDDKKLQTVREILGIIKSITFIPKLGQGQNSGRRSRR